MFRWNTKLEKAFITRLFSDFQKAQKALKSCQGDTATEDAHGYDLVWLAAIECKAMCCISIQTCRLPASWLTLIISAWGSLELSVPTKWVIIGALNVERVTDKVSTLFYLGSKLINLLQLPEQEIVGYIFLII